MKCADNKKNVLIIGLGFVGQANALALLKMGFNVFGVDVKNVKNIYKDRDFKKIKILNIQKVGSDNEVRRLACPVLICVNAPTISKRPFQNIAAVKTALKIGRLLTSGPIILRTTLLPRLLYSLDFDLYVPEFLHKKYAVAECLKPELMALGSYKKISTKNLPFFIKKLTSLGQARTLFCSPQEAAFAKYASNLFNALRISYINEFGDFIKQDGFDPDKIVNFLFQKKSYLRYGKSFDDDCLPKDVKAFASEYGSSLLSQIIKTNDAHKIKEGELKKIFSRN